MLQIAQYVILNGGDSFWIKRWQQAACNLLEHPLQIRVFLFYLSRFIDLLKATEQIHCEGKEGKASLEAPTGQYCNLKQLFLSCIKAGTNPHN